MPETLITAEDVSKKFCRDLKHSLWYGLNDSVSQCLLRETKAELRKDEFWANDSISFELRRGESLGLVGRNGAGKTTLLKILNGLIKPDIGRVRIKGKVGALIALGAGFNPILTGRENVQVNASILGLSRKQIGLLTDEIIEFSEIGEFIDAPVQSYSSGMQVRLGFSIASRLNPDVFLVDEVLAVGDYRFKAKAQEAILQRVHQGTSVVFVSHNLHEVAGVTNKCIWLEKGQIRMTGDTPDVLGAYQSDDDAALSAKGYRYSPNRSGLAILTEVTTDLAGPAAAPTKASPPHSIHRLPPQPASITLLLKLTFDIRYQGRVWHGLNIATHDGRHVGRAVVHGMIDVKEGDQESFQLTLECPPLLPGVYRIEYFLWQAGGVMLEGMFNLIEFECTADDSKTWLRNRNDNYVVEKMSDNSRGALPLQLHVTKGDTALHSP